MTAINPSFLESLFVFPFNLITPAVLLGIFWYGVKLMGRMVDDYIPYSDDRKYSIELNGMYFFLNIVALPSVFATVLFIIIKKHLTIIPSEIMTWVTCLLILIIYSVCLIKLKYYGMIFFGDKENIIKSQNLLELLPEKSKNKIKNFLFSTIRKQGLIIGIVILIIMINYHISTNIFSNIISTIFGILTIFTMPSHYAMNTQSLLLSNIELNDGTIYKNCEIIKITESFARFRLSDKINLLNRETIKKIEVLGPVNKIIK